jgi:two-component system, OmpR family, KDP operon response regulator KdpE
LEEYVAKEMPAPRRLAVTLTKFIPREKAMKENRRILVVDDEPQILRVLSRSLASVGYEIRVASDGDEALAVLSDWMPDLVITDLVMPKMDGLELCERLRAVSPIPIIVLSASGEEHIKVEALDLGADDYITKPFSMDELRARVRAALRRPELDVSGGSNVIETGDFRVNLETRSVIMRGQEIRLTPKEYELLVYLIRHPGKVHTHRVLLSVVWGKDYIEQPEYLRVFIGHLRKKIEPDHAKPRYILTEPWVGYRFNPAA